MHSRACSPGPKVQKAACKIREFMGIFLQGVLKKGCNAEG